MYSQWVCLTLPLSIGAQSIMMAGILFSHTILHVSVTVSSRGPVEEWPHRGKICKGEQNRAKHSPWAAIYAFFL